MIRSILYATDLGWHASYVLQHALSLARTFSAELFVVHVVEPVGPFAESLMQSYFGDDALRELRGAGTLHVMKGIEDRVHAAFRNDLKESQEDLAFINAIRVIQGDPCRMILEQARKLNVDLVVLGSRGQKAEACTAVGRTASHVLQMSEVPVYMVPPLVSLANAE